MNQLLILMFEQKEGQSFLNNILPLIFTLSK